MLAIAIFLNVACQQHQQPQVPDEIEEISILADTNAKAALITVELMEKKYADAEEAVQMRLALLKTKAKDKAYISLTDDTLMKKVVDFYDKYGTVNQRLEAYYYLAGTYRDLQDSPRALTTYLQAAELGEENIIIIDSLKLFYVYSQLSSLYCAQNNDLDAISAYQKAISLKRGFGKLDVWDYTVMAQSYYQFGDIDSCVYYYKKAMNELIEHGINHCSQGNIGSMLAKFVRLNYPEFAQLCYSWLCAYPIEDLTGNCCCAKGLYFQKNNQIDSAEYYFQIAYDRLPESHAKRDCALIAYQMFDSLHNHQKTLDWAERYIENSRAANEEMALEHVSQINNEYKYRRDMEAEAKLKEEALRADKQRWMAVAGLLALIVAAIVASFVYRKRYMFLKAEHLILERRIEKEARKQARLALELSDLLVMFRSLNGAPDEVTWDTLFASVDKAYPDFRVKVETVFPHLTTSYLQLLYLFKAGMKRIEIARVFDVDRAVISRKVQRMEAQLGQPLESL